ncbi:MAG: hypothetical protein RLZZ142_2060, partial [Verrucomicrobiota bacterium]
MNPEPDAPELDLEQEVLELLDAFHDGLWSAEQESRLHTLLREDARARNIFIREQLLAAELHHLHQHTPGSGLEPHPEPLDFSPLRPPRDPQPTKAARFPRPWRWGAAAALFLLGLALGWAFRLPTPRALAEETDDGVALLVQSVAPSWIGQRQPNANHILSAGSLRLASGLAQIEFYSGARLILHGPAELELRSAHEAVCHSGRIRVSVPAQARGFKLTTPHGLVRDQGSEFGLETDPLTASRIQVFSGTLEVVPLESAPAPRTPRRLSAGEHFAWNASQTLPSQSLDAEHFASF